MNTLLWITQAVLSLLFTMAGLMKATQPVEKLAAKITWAPRFSPVSVKLIGISEFLIGVGLVAPMVFGVQVQLTVMAALGLCLVMFFAAIHHLKHAETKAVVANMIILSLAAFVAYGRNGSLMGHS